jgi:hypothetical protein
MFLEPPTWKTSLHPQASLDHKVLTRAPLPEVPWLPPEKPPMAKEGKGPRPLSEASPGTVPFPFSEPFYRHGPASRVEPWQRIPDVSTFVGPSPSDRETSAEFLQVIGSPWVTGASPWQQTPDVSTHFGLLLPIGLEVEARWRREPDVSAHIRLRLPVIYTWNHGWSYYLRLR